MCPDDVITTRVGDAVNVLRSPPTRPPRLMLALLQVLRV
jgi:hypothetical protein